MKDKLLGVYDYTVLLTYASFVIAVCGIYCAIEGNSIAAIMCLMGCGVCDLFDGRVARTKKNRTQSEKRFGIQIDSLTDLVCFGVLPCVIGYSTGLKERYYLVCYALFSLSAMIRLAYFNVLEEERQDTETGNRKYYLGVPVTSTAMVFPLACAVRFVNQTAFSIVMAVIYLLYSIMFISKVKVKKPGLPAIIVMILIGLAELAVYIFLQVTLS